MIDIDGLHEVGEDAADRPALAGSTANTSVCVNWCEEANEEAWRDVLLSALTKGGSATRLVSNTLSERMPHRLALALCEEAGVANQRVADLTKDKREHLIRLLTNYSLPYTGTFATVYCDAFIAPQLFF